MIRTLVRRVKNQCRGLIGHMFPEMYNSYMVKKQVRSDALWYVKSLIGSTKKASKNAQDRTNEQCDLFKEFDYIVPVLVQAEVRNLHVLPMIQFGALYAATQQKLGSHKVVSISTYRQKFHQMMQTFDSTMTYTDTFCRTVIPMLSPEEFVVFTKLRVCPEYRDDVYKTFAREARRNDYMLCDTLEPEAIRLMPLYKRIPYYLQTHRFVAGALAAIGVWVCGGISISNSH